MVLAGWGIRGRMPRRSEVAPLDGGQQLVELVDDRRRRRARASASRPTPRSTPTTSPKSPAAPALTPDSASSTTAHAVGRQVEQLGGALEHVGRRLAGGCPRGRRRRRRRRRSNRSAMPAAASTEGAFFELETTATSQPARVTRVEQRERCRVGGHALLGERGVEGVVLAVAEAVHGVGGRGRPSRRPRQCGCRGSRAATAPRRSGACRRCTRSSRPRTYGVAPCASRYGREQPRPGVHVHDRGGREHAVEVEEPAADAAEVDVARIDRSRGSGGVVGRGHRRPFVASVRAPVPLIDAIPGSG